MPSLSSMGEDEAERDAGEAEEGKRRDPLGEKEGAEPRRGDRAERQEDGDLGGRRVVQRP